MNKIFVKTKNVKGFINLIYSLKNKPDNISKIGLIYGEAGLGKTKTALYLSIQFDAIYVRATNSMTPKWLLEEIAKELDEIPRFYTADIFRQCVNALKIKPQMIIVDEIDYLLADFRTIETLRDLHDETGVPVILVGMKLARHKLKKHTHLFDRISEIYNFTDFEFTDIKQIVEELSEVEITKDAVKLVQNKATSFRQIVQMIDNFEKVAREQSEDTMSAKKGGDLGFFAKSDMIEPFASQAFKQQPNAIGPVIQTQYGYHIIKVTDRMVAGTEPFVKVKDQIKLYLQTQKQMKILQTLITQLKTDAKIEYVDESFDPQKIQEKLNH